MLVNLDALFPTSDPPPAGPPTAAGDRDRDRLELSGWAIGMLHRWLRSSTGQWIGVCTVLITRADGGTYRAVDQLVPAQALRQRAN